MVNDVSFHTWRTAWLPGGAHWQVRLPIMGAVLLLSAVVAIKPALQAIGALLVVVPLVAFLRWPVLGLAGVIVAGQLTPFRIATGTQTDLNAAVLLVALLLVAWIVQMLVQHELRLVASPAVLSALALAGVAILAFAVGQHPWVTLVAPAPLQAQLGGMAMYVLSAGGFLLVAHRVRTQWSLQFLTWVFLLVATVFVIGEVARDFGAPVDHLTQPGAAGSLFWVWLAALGSSQALFNSRLALKWRVALGITVVASLVHSMSHATDWLSGYVPPLVAIVTMVAARSPRAAVVALLLFGVAAVLARGPIADAFQTGTDALPPVAASSRDLLSAHVDSDSSTRTEFWRTLGQLIQLDPVLGLGPANYAWYAVMFPTSQAAWGYLKISSHNNYVDLVAQTGFVGLLCFLWFVAAVGRVGWGIRGRLPDGFPRAYVYGALGGLAGSVVAAALGDWVLPFVYNIGYDGFRASVLGWLFLGGVIALQQIFAAQPGAQDRMPV